MYDKTIDFIRDIYSTKDFIPLHEPKFIGNEKYYLNECIDSTYVSSVGKYVDKFEEMISEYTKSGYAVVTVNGTAALHIALLLAGVQENDEVLTQPLSFIATCNAISYCGAKPVFIDVDKDTLGLSPEKLDSFLQENAIIKDDGCCYNKITSNRITACVPMHTFGHPAKIDKIISVCKRYNILVVEDAAESLGSKYKDKHTGTFGKLGIYSFNGNKTVTCGGGGMIVTDDKKLAKKSKHITTTAKIPHKWEYIHDEIGFNYRLPNINAALACAQMENLDKFIQNKRELAGMYKSFFEGIGIPFLNEPDNSYSNFWLNGIIMENREERDIFLDYTNSHGVMTRPIWRLMNKLSMFKECLSSGLENSEWLEERVVNIPSSVRINQKSAI